MRTIAFANNKGGVGKTTSVYHLAYMFAELGVRVVAFDMDPQANLTSFFLQEEQLETLWEPEDGGDTILGCIQPIRQGLGDINPRPPLEIAEKLWLLPGHLGLSLFEDKLSESWAKGFQPDPGALRATTAIYRIMRETLLAAEAELGLVDVGPNLGAINRSVLIGTDNLILPLAADLFSIQGLRNLGPTIRKWAEQWQRMKEIGREQTRDLNIAWPDGLLRAIGYIVLQHEVRLDRPVKAFDKWLNRIPTEYRSHVLAEKTPPELVPSPADDPYRLGSLRNYRSLMPMAHDARKPMFDLKAADGAIGSHADLVRRCRQDFENLARTIAGQVGLPVPEGP